MADQASPLPHIRPCASTPLSFPQRQQSVPIYVMPQQQYSPMSTHFHGWISEDPLKFISDFESHITLMGIDKNSNLDKTLAAFRLQLLGPALVWYSSLHDIDKQSFFTVKEKFLQEFNGLDSPALVAEEASFQNLKLETSQRIEDFYTSVVQKGAHLHKSDRDIFHKFVSGLPEKLAFFVRASRVATIREALNQARIGEAHGYREQVPKQTSALHADSSRHQKKDNKCYRCGGCNHFKAKCNWNSQGQSSPGIVCQLCEQDGHTALNCKHNPCNFKPVTCQICGDAHSARNCPQLNYSGLGQHQPVHTSQA